MPRERGTKNQQVTSALLLAQRDARRPGYPRVKPQRSSGSDHYHHIRCDGIQNRTSKNCKYFFAKLRPSFLGAPNRDGECFIH